MKLNMKIMVRFQIQVFSSYEIISLKIVRIQKNVTLKWMVLIKYCITSNIIFVATSLIFYYIGVFPFSLPFLNCRFKAGFILNSIFFFFFFWAWVCPRIAGGKRERLVIHSRWHLMKYYIWALLTLWDFSNIFFTYFRAVSHSHGKMISTKQNVFLLFNVHSLSLLYDQRKHVLVCPESFNSPWRPFSLYPILKRK